MNGLKRFVGISVGLFVLGLLVGGIVLWNIDPNNYKSKIVQLVKEKTGRTLHIEGNIQLSFWPELELRVNQVRLENASNHDAFATIKQAFVQVKLFPLLKREVEINSLILEGVTLALVRQAEGHGNWEDLWGGNSENSEQPAWVKTFTLHEFKIREARWFFHDQLNNEHYECSEMNLEVLQNFTQVHLNSTLETPKFKQFFKLSSQLDINPELIKVRGLNIQTLNTVLTGELQAEHFLTDHLKLVGNLKFQWSPAQQNIRRVTAETAIEANLSQVTLNRFHIDVDHHSLSFPKLSLDLTQQKLEGESFLLNVAGIKLRGHLKGKQLFTQALFSGQFNSEPFKFSQLFVALNIPQVPWQAQRTTLKTEFEVSPSAIHLNHFIFQLEDHQLEIPQLRFHFAQQTVITEVFSVDILGKKLAVRGKLIGKEIFKQPQWTGEVVLNSSKLQEVLNYLGYPLGALHRASLKSQFDVTTHDILLTDAHLTLDEQEFSSPKLNFSRTSRQLTVDQWTSKVFGGVGEGNLHIGPRPFNNYQIQGQLRITEFNLRNLLDKLGKGILTTDQTVLNQVSLETQMTGNLSQLGFEHFNLHWDNSQLQGRIDIEDFKQPKMKFDLSLDKIDLPRYLPPSRQDKTKNDFILLFKQLHELNLEGSMKIAQLKMTSLEVTGVKIVFKGNQKRAEENSGKVGPLK